MCEASAWETRPIEEVAVEIIDYRGKSPRKSESGIPLVTAKIVKNGRIDPPTEFIPESDYYGWMRRGIPEPGDVVITTEAPLGEVAQLGPDKVALAQRLIVLRARPDLMANRFLKYALVSSAVQHQLHARATGTTVLGIKQSELRKVEIPIPPLPTQRYIAHILGTLDDKIELNRRMNRTLEAIARAIFKSWFVDFDPVDAKAKGREPIGMDPETASLFPDSFQDFPLGKIPKGWEVGQLGDVAMNPRRGIQPSEIEPRTPYIALEHMPKQCITLDEWATADAVQSNKFEFKKGEILFGKLRPYFHKVGIAPVNGVCSTDIVVMAPKADKWFVLVLEHVSSAEFVKYTDASSTGTKMPRTNWREMERYQIVLPPVEIAGVLTERISSLLEQIISAIPESRTLASLRDTLLPKLISGKLRVKAAEQLTERSRE